MNIASQPNPDYDDRIAPNSPPSLRLSKMHKIADILHRHGGSDGSGQLHDEGPIQIGPQDFYRYRKQRGVNLGTLFFQEFELLVSD